MSTSALKDTNNENRCFGVVLNSKFFENWYDKNENSTNEPIKEIIYRHDGKTVDKIIEYAPNGITKKQVTNYDYFNDKKIKSIEEFDQETGNLKRITTFTLFKSVTNYDIKTGKKLKTTNFDLKTSTKKTSIYDYDIETEKISRVTVFRADGKSVSMVKELNPTTGIVERVINYKKGSSAISSVSKYEFQGDKTIKTTFYYNTPMYFTSPITFNKKLTADTLNKKVLDNNNKKQITKLIDNLYRNKLSFSSISV